MIGFDEAANAGCEHFDPAYVAGYDAKSGVDRSLRARAPRASRAFARDDRGRPWRRHRADGDPRSGGRARGRGGRRLGADAGAAPRRDRAARTRRTSASSKPGSSTYEHEGPPATLVHSRNALHHLPDPRSPPRCAGRRAAGADGRFVLRDLVWSFPREQANEVSSAGSRRRREDSSRGWTRAELEEHVRTEHSPCERRPGAHARGCGLRDPGARVPLADVRRLASARVMKKRLDVLLVERGLAESRAQAQALVMAGLVPGYDKPGQQVDEDAELERRARRRRTSRAAGEARARPRRARRRSGRARLLDVGASTGGFTDVLLAARRGARDRARRRLRAAPPADPQRPARHRPRARRTRAR